MQLNVEMKHPQRRAESKTPSARMHPEGRLGGKNSYNFAAAALRAVKAFC